LGVAYGSDPALVASLFETAVVEQQEVLTEPKPEIIFEDFGDNALIFESYFWCDVSGEKTMRHIRSEIRFRVDKLFQQNGIVIAFPQRDVHLHAPSPIRVSVDSNNSSGGDNLDQ
ncbi:MAG: mechanosensitive ion channel, partial [Gammaproteobacteria bacterium]|nr:mechanosensitive ion channel [Gammaproteobacteria bacterium]